MLPIVALVVLAGLWLITVPTGIAFAAGAPSRAPAGARAPELYVVSARVTLTHGDLLSGAVILDNVGMTRARASAATVSLKLMRAGRAVGSSVEIGHFRVVSLASGHRIGARFRLGASDRTAGGYEVIVCASTFGRAGRSLAARRCRSAGAVTIEGGVWQLTTDLEPPAAALLSGPFPLAPAPTAVTSKVTTTHTTRSTVTTTHTARSTSATTTTSRRSTTTATTTTSHPTTTTTTTTTARRSTTTTTTTTARRSTTTTTSSTATTSSPTTTTTTTSVTTTTTTPATTTTTTTTTTSVTSTTQAPPARVELCGTIDHDETLAVEAAPVYVLTCNVTVGAGAVLTLGPGVVVKGEQFSSLIVDGSLVSEGTQAAPATITSINDDALGGLSGTGSPAAGDWGGIEVQKGASAQLRGTVLEYASTALSSAAGAQVLIAGGAILHSTAGVVASEFVEAEEVDWGSPSGPAPFGTGERVEGEVLATRWAGFQAPAAPARGSPPQATDETTCRQVLFLGARGSAESPQGSEPYAADELENMGTRVRAVEAGLRAKLASDALAAGTAPLAVRPVALRYPALPANGIGSVAQLNYLLRERAYLDNIWEGVYSLESTLSTEEARCGEREKIVLAGYSSGALIVHLALAEMEGEGVISPSLIAAVVLIADPARAAGEGVIEKGSAPAAGEGIFARFFGVHPLPPSLAGRTISLCDGLDIICSTEPGANSGVHGSYSGAELEPLGAGAAEEVLAAG